MHDNWITVENEEIYACCFIFFGLFILNNNDDRTHLRLQYIIPSISMANQLCKIFQMHVNGTTQIESVECLYV